MHSQPLMVHFYILRSKYLGNMHACFSHSFHISNATTYLNVHSQKTSESVRILISKLGNCGTGYHPVERRVVDSVSTQQHIFSLCKSVIHKAAGAKTDIIIVDPSTLATIPKTFLNEVHPTADFARISNVQKQTDSHIGLLPLRNSQFS